MYMYIYIVYLHVNGGCSIVCCVVLRFDKDLCVCSGFFCSAQGHAVCCSSQASPGVYDIIMM